ncbi:hypothetical protein KFK09_020972 [Dendrobium nobile]|uniref:Uncharacterized protein n=1 Tax=Dendrobium nobile TaxID=94219 RepID=A0A8T3ANX6_DENNO|nr:hypothetical protein KFK09_020972 [Dendrobium nobile]
MFHARTKHIEIDHRFIRDHIQHKIICLLPISTVDQLADILTKPLPTSRFKLLRTKLTITQDPLVIAVFCCMICYANGINEIFDIEIDKINKPYLPLASGEMSMTTAIAITSAFAIAGFAIVSHVGSRPLFWGSFLYFLIFTAYSTDLPFLRWKKREITAALSIIAGRGIAIQISTFLHMQTFVLGRQTDFSRPLILGTIVVSIFCVVIALLKDVPDIEGDKKFGIRSLAASLGPKKVFRICICLLEMVYIIAIVFGATSSRPWSKLITILGHSVLALFLWKQTMFVDLHNKFSVESFHILIWQLLSAEYMLLPLVR